MKIKPNRTHLSLIFFLFFIGLNLAGLFFLNQETEKIAATKNSLSARSQLSKEDLASFADIGKIETLFPTEDDLLNFMRGIESSKISLKDLNISFETDKPENSGGANYLTFVLTFTSSYEKGMAYLEKIIKSPAVLEVINFQANGKEGLGEETKFEIRAKLFVSDKYTQ